MKKNLTTRWQQCRQRPVTPETHEKAYWLRGTNNIKRKQAQRRKDVQLLATRTQLRNKLKQRIARGQAMTVALNDTGVLTASMASALRRQGRS